MAKRNIFIFKRRAQGKTNYKKRLESLKSGKARLVVRRSLNHVRASVVEYVQEGDKTVTGANSAELRKLGWKGHCGNIPSAYLTGLLCASKALGKGVSEAVSDIGLATPVQKSVPFAALQGAVDGGLSVPIGGEFNFKEEEFNGSRHSKELAENFNAVREKIKAMTPQKVAVKAVGGKK